MLRNVIAATLLATTVCHSAHALDTLPETIAKDIHDGYFRRALVHLQPLMQSHAADAQFQYQYGTALVGTKKFDEGLLALRTAIELEPANGIYHRGLGEAYGAQAQQV